MLEHEHAERDLGWGASASASTAVFETSSHRGNNAVDERLVIEQLVDATKAWIHLGLRIEIAESKRLPQAALPIATTNHPLF